MIQSFLPFDATGKIFLYIRKSAKVRKLNVKRNNRVLKFRVLLKLMLKRQQGFSETAALLL